jgi:hypothetical protein
MPKFFLLGVLWSLAPVLGLAQAPELAAGSFLVSRP